MRRRRYGIPSVNENKRRASNYGWKLHKRTAVTYRPDDNTMHHLEVDREWEPEDGVVMMVVLKIKKNPVQT